MSQQSLIEQQRHQALSARVAELEAVVREQERTIQHEQSARALAVERLKAVQKTLRNRRAAAAKGANARS